jgi:nicotinamidase-related amidase
MTVPAPYALGPDTSLLVLDVQQKLLDVMPEDRQSEFVGQLEVLIDLAAETDSPIIYTEQYPDGLGHTVTPLRDSLEAHASDYLEKVHFNACAAPGAPEAFSAISDRVVVTGMETHICVWSTVRQLLADGHDVFVPFDAVLSRRDSYRENGLSMMESAGAQLTNTETIVFDTLEDANHPNFKQFSKAIR